MRNNLPAVLDHLGDHDRLGDHGDPAKRRIIL